MSRLGNISYRKCVTALQRDGFYIARQESSHIVLVRETPLAKVTVPCHKELKKGTLRSIIRQAGLTVDEFVALLKD